jgi:hypothetical protein
MRRRPPQADFPTEFRQEIPTSSGLPARQILFHALTIAEEFIIKK